MFFSVHLHFFFLFEYLDFTLPGDTKVALIAQVSSKGHKYPGRLAYISILQVANILALLRQGS